MPLRVSYTQLFISAPVYIAQFSSEKEAGLPLFRRGRKGESCWVFNSFIILAQPPQKRASLFLQVFTTNFREVLGLPLVEIWWVVYPPLGLLSAVPCGKGPGDSQCFQDHIMVRHKTVHVHCEGECEVGTLPSTTLTLFPITLSARIQGHIRLL